MYSIGYVVLFVVLGTLPLLYHHHAAHHVLNLPQACLALFSAINLLICIWEIGLFINRKLIKAQYLALKKLLPRGTLPQPMFMFEHVPLRRALTLEHWAWVWSTYSLMDPSYSDQKSYGCVHAHCPGGGGAPASMRPPPRAHGSVHFSCFRPHTRTHAMPQQPAANRLLHAATAFVLRHPASLGPALVTNSQCARPALQLLCGRGQWLPDAGAHRPVRAEHDVGRDACAHHGRHWHHHLLPRAVWCVWLQWRMLSTCPGLRGCKS